MKRAALLLALVFLASGLAQASRVASPHEPWERPLESYSPGHLHFRLGDVAVTRPMIPFFEGIPMPLQVFYRNPAETPVEGTVRIQVEEGAWANVSTLTLNAPPGGVWQAPVLVRLDGAGGAVHASLDGRPEASTRIGATPLPPLSVHLTSLVPHDRTDPRGTRNIVGATEEVSFDAIVTNHGNRTVQGMALVLKVNGEDAATVPLDPPLEPGERREIDLPEKTFPLEDPRRRDSSHEWKVLLRDDARTREGPEEAYTFTVEEGRLASALQAEGYLRVTREPAVLIEEARVELGKPSLVTLVAKNFANETMEATVRLRVDSSVLRLHPSWRIPGLEEEVTLEPGEARTFEHRFTPRVAADLRIDASISTLHGGMGTGKRVDMPSPIRITLVEGVHLLTGGIGTPLSRSVEVTSSVDLPGAVVRFAVAPRHAGTYDGLVNQDDLATMAFNGDPTPGLAAGEPRRYAFTLTPRASGMYLVVPYVEAGGVVYLGEFDPTDTGRTPDDFYEAQSLGATLFVAKVPPYEKSPLLPLIPGLALVGGTAGLWIRRRHYVR